MTITRFCCLIAVVVTFALSHSHVALAAEGPAKRPNIVFIYSDDHATNAIGAYGGRLAKLDPTPHIDKLARQGIRFDRRLRNHGRRLRQSNYWGDYHHRYLDDLDVASNKIFVRVRPSCFADPSHESLTPTKSERPPLSHIPGGWTALMFAAKVRIMSVRVGGLVEFVEGLISSKF